MRHWLDRIPATTAGNAPNCMGCHKISMNASGTTTSCQDCHGTNNTVGRPNGGTNAFPNYSGAHTTHALTKGYTCVQCHSNGGTGSPNHGSSNRIASTNVTFVHVSSVAAYPFHWSGNTTTGNCSNAYCHSSVQAANGTGAPTYVDRHLERRRHHLHQLPRQQPGHADHRQPHQASGCRQPRGTDLRRLP